jgi:hypothetical protein
MLPSTDRFVKEILVPNDTFVDKSFRAAYHNYEEWCKECDMDISFDKKFTASLRNHCIKTKRDGHFGTTVLIKN